MANPRKCRENYNHLVGNLNSLASGDTPADLDSNMRTLFYQGINGFLPPEDSVEAPKSDFSRNSLKAFRSYLESFHNRRTVQIHGAERTVATESQVYEDLSNLHYIASEILLPFSRKSTDFTNHVFKDIYELSLSLVGGIANGVSQEYIPKEEALEEKLHASNVAKSGERIHGVYETQGLEKVNHLLKNFWDYLSNVKPDHLREFEFCPVSPKKISHKKRCIQRLKEKLTEVDEEGMEFRPSIIVPIAHGGIELGVILSNHYDDSGVMNILYPLMFSMKTRRQRQPWTEYDEDFLSNNLEGKEALITEDWITTGNTARGIIGSLEQTFPREIRLATLKRDPIKSDIPFLNKYMIYSGEESEYKGNKTDSLSEMSD